MEVKRCPNCGDSLPAGASFCPHCMARLAEEKALPSPIPTRSTGKAPLAALLILAGTAFVLLLFLFRPGPSMPPPPAATPSAPVVTPSPEPLAQYKESTTEKPQFDDERIYRLVYPHGTWSLFTYEGENYMLGFSLGTDVPLDAKTARRGPNANTQERFTILIMEGEGASLTEAPALYEQIDTIEVSIQTEGEAVVSLFDKPYFELEFGRYTQVVHAAPGNGSAKLTVDITFLDGSSASANCSYYVSTFTPHIYRWEDNSIGTIEELQAMLDALSAYDIEEDEVTIYLPPVTYDGTLRIDSFPVKLIGHQDGDARTTIRGGIHVAPLQDWSVELSKLDFMGKGMEDTSAENRAVYGPGSAFIDYCSFTGYAVAISSEDDGFKSARNDNRFYKNDIALSYDLTRGGFDKQLLTLTSIFEQNRVGIQIARMPEESLTSGSFNYYHNTFRGNEIDAVNHSNLAIYFNGCSFLDVDDNTRDPIIQLTGAGGFGMD